MTTTLRDRIGSVRSKNAGPFVVTFDLFFESAADYRAIVDSGRLTPAAVADIYGLEADQVRVSPFEPAMAIKIAIPRQVPGGSPGDTDVAGGQQFVPLLSLEL